jgi:hypothetical protein
MFSTGLQFSYLSEKTLLRIEIQLRTTTAVQPIKPVKNMISKMSLHQIISFDIMPRTLKSGHY